MTKKAPNYTDAQTAEITAGYLAAVAEGGPENGADWVNDYAEANGRKASSVRAKLVREGHYIKPERASKRSATKAEIVTAIAQMCDTPDDVVGSLEKATARALGAVLATLRQMREELDERNTDEEGESFPLAEG